MVKDIAKMRFELTDKEKSKIFTEAITG